MLQPLLLLPPRLRRMVQPILLPASAAALIATAAGLVYVASTQPNGATPVDAGDGARSLCGDAAAIASSCCDDRDAVDPAARVADAADAERPWSACERSRTLCVTAADHHGGEEHDQTGVPSCHWLSVFLAATRQLLF
eukprot:364968-Chlamydomonas_euryale.AAC.18